MAVRPVPLFLLTIMLTGCHRTSCLADSNVRKHFADAAKLELEGKLQAARSQYKDVDLFSGSQSGLSFAAESNAIRLSKVITTAYNDTLAALEAYMAMHGHYPDSLAEISGAIPERSRLAFAGFEYAKNRDGTVGIVTGLYGVHTFDLSAR
jgi:hypothetical protein